MNTDKTTKTLLAPISILLGFIAIGPSTVSQAQAQIQSPSFANFMFSGAGPGFYLFDQNTGKVFYCENPRGGALVEFVGKVQGPGKPLLR